MKAIREKLYQRRLAKKLKRFKRTFASTNIEDAKEIGILFNATLPETWLAIRPFASKLRKEGKKIKIMGFIDDSGVEPNSQSFDCFSRKDIDWIYRPKNKFVQKFMLTPFDILFCLWFDSHPSLQYMSRLSKAHFKVGAHLDTEEGFDLMVDINGKKDYEKLIQTLESYLTHVNPPTVWEKHSLNYAARE